MTWIWYVFNLVAVLHIQEGVFKKQTKFLLFFSLKNLKFVVLLYVLPSYFNSWNGLLIFFGSGPNPIYMQFPHIQAYFFTKISICLCGLIFLSCSDMFSEHSATMQWTVVASGGQITWKHIARKQMWQEIWPMYQIVNSAKKQKNSRTGRRHTRTVGIYARTVSK